MSTLSPQLVRSESPTDMRFPNANFSDPYLSAPSDPEQDDFKSSGIRVTPERGQQDLREVSTAPYNVNCDSLQGAETAGYTTSYSEFLSPVDDFSSYLSARASPFGDA